MQQVIESVIEYIKKDVIRAKQQWRESIKSLQTFIQLKVKISNRLLKQLRKIPGWLQIQQRIDEFFDNSNSKTKPKQVQNELIQLQQILLQLLNKQYSECSNSFLSNKSSMKSKLDKSIIILSEQMLSNYQHQYNDKEQNDKQQNDKQYQYMKQSKSQKSTTYAQSIKNQSLKAKPNFQKTKNKYIKQQQEQKQQKQQKILNKKVIVNKNQNSIQQINGKDVSIIAKFLITQVDPNYQINNKHIKQSIQQYIYHYLNINQISVLNSKIKIPIIQDTLYQQSSDFGNYQFDPFCDSVQFYVMRNNNQQLNKSFKVIGKPSIIYQFVQNQKQWSKNNSLRPTDQIQKLLKHLCDKKQQSQSTYQKTIQAFKGHSVKLIRNLFEWTKQDYQKMHLKITWIYQLVEIVSRIKDQPAVDFQINKKTSSSKQDCLKISNSHKILRYVVLKVHGENQLNKLPKINYQNMVKAIQIVKKQVINNQLLQQLSQYFYQFTYVPQQNQKRVDQSRGLILHGPPGTGKSVLTQALPNIIGFHLISEGLSAADFMKSLVGESSRMIKDLANRASLSPHLVCSVGIDQVDGLVPDRKDKDQKNKGQGISILLSVIGGNKDVPNLLYFTSTNYLKKIDEAIRRRLSGQFQVGRPNSDARKQIMKDLTFISKDSQMLNYLQNITTNFTGAALKRLKGILTMKRSRKMRQKKGQILTREEVTEGTIQAAKQFSITLGAYTFPQIYSNRANKKYIFTEKFLNKIANGFLLINEKQNSTTQFLISYANVIEKYTQNYGQCQLSEFHQVFSDNFKINDYFGLGFQNFQNWIKKSLSKSKYTIKVIQNLNESQKCLQQYEKTKIFKVPCIILMKAVFDNQGAFLYDLMKTIQKNKTPNFFVLYYVQFHNLITPEKLYNFMYWQSSKNKPYTGRIFVQLNDQPRMAFQLDTSEEEQTKLSFRYFMKSQKQNKPNDIIPELVEFFNQRQVSCIMLIDYQLCLQNAANEQQKMRQVIQQKMSEAFNYSKVAVIFNLDSLLIMNQSSSDSSMGRSVSYSLADPNMYRFILSYLQQFPSMVKVVDTKNTPQQSKIRVNNVSKIRRQGKSQRQNNTKQLQKLQYKQQKWVGIIAKNPQLIKLIKKDLAWPKTPSQRQQDKQQEDLQRQRRCYRCKLIYTQEQNRKQRKCVQHNGPLIDIRNNKLQQQLTLQQAKIEQMLYKRNKNSKNDKKQSDDIFVFACCFKGLNQPGEGFYYHITKQEYRTDKDDLFNYKNQNRQQWQSAQDYLSQKNIKMKQN